MKIAVIHDYADVFRTTRAFQRLKGHDVVVQIGRASCRERVYVLV